MTISNQTRSRIKKLGEPVALALGRAGLTPDGLTFIGFVITAGGAVLLANQLWLAGGLVVLGGASFDMLDGALARASGRVSRFGAFLDSVLDRGGEALVYVGLVWGTLDLGLWRPVVLAAAAMAAAFMVSYVRAKAEGLGFSPGTGTRHEKPSRNPWPPRRVRMAARNLTRRSSTLEHAPPSTTTPSLQPARFSGV